MSGPRPTVSDPPDSPAALRGFPRRNLPAGEEVARVVRAGAEPWWFSSDGAGRFDLSSPHGSCYVADDDLTALLEVLGPTLAGGVVASDSLDSRRLRTLRLPNDTATADTTSRRAVGFGVTAEIGTSVAYDCSRRWAAALHAAGFDGVRWWPRHDPARAGRAIALFGRAGARRSWPRGRERRIDAALRSRLVAECGVRVAPRPRLDRLTIASDPLLDSGAPTPRRPPR